MEDARDRKRRKHHDDEDRDRKRHHHHKKDRDKDKKHKSDHHEKRRSDRERAEKQPPTHSDIDPISEDDYFKRSAEFRDWLREDRGRYFEDLTSEDARKQFKKFVSKWNAGECAAPSTSRMELSRQLLVAPSMFGVLLPS